MQNMSDDFPTNITDSAYDTKRLVLPKIQELKWLQGEFTQIEITTDKEFKKLAKSFDTLSGVDIWQVENKNGIIGIANRIQWPYKWNKNLATFTVRYELPSGYETEYQKRYRALNSKGKYIYPYIAIQSYIKMPRRKGSLIAMGMGFTKDIIKMILEGKCRKRENPRDHNKFYAVYWNEMREYGFEVHTWRIKDESLQSTLF